MANCHHANVYWNWKQFSAAHTDQRFARRVWNAHVARNGNVPFITKCSECSGKDEKRALKLGYRTPKRPTREERNEERAAVTEEE